MTTYAPSQRAQQQGEEVRDVHRPSHERSPDVGLVDGAMIRGVIQGQLRIGTVDDPLEREADEIADRVLRMPNSYPRLTQRWQGCYPEDEKLRRQSLDDEDEEYEEEEVAQFKARTGKRRPIDTATATAISQRRGTGQPLSQSTRSFLEPRLGADLSSVRVHADSQAQALAQRVNARAFTVGLDVFFGVGEYAPETHRGRRLLIHELVHVKQQGAAGMSSSHPLTPVKVATSRSLCLPISPQRSSGGNSSAKVTVAHSLDGPAGFDSKTNEWISRPAGHRAIVDRLGLGLDRQTPPVQSSTRWTLQRKRESNPVAKRLTELLADFERRVRVLATEVLPGRDTRLPEIYVEVGGESWSKNKSYFGFRVDSRNEERGEVVVNRDDVSYVLDEGIFAQLFTRDFPAALEAVVVPAPISEGLAGPRQRKHLTKTMPGRLSSHEQELVKYAIRTIQMLPQWAHLAPGIRQHLDEGRLFSAQLDRYDAKNKPYGLTMRGGTIFIDFGKHASHWTRDQAHYRMLGSTLIHEYYHAINPQATEDEVTLLGNEFQDDFNGFTFQLVSIAKNKCRGEQQCLLEHNRHKYILHLPIGGPSYVTLDERVFGIRQRLRELRESLRSGGGTH